MSDVGRAACTFSLIVSRPNTHRSAVDISERLRQRWNTPVSNIVGLDAQCLDSPLDPEQKIPISGSIWQSLLFLYGDHLKLLCLPEDLSQLFILNDDEYARFIWPNVYNVIGKAPQSVSGTEDSFHAFWDGNIRDILNVGSQQQPGYVYWNFEA